MMETTAECGTHPADLINASSRLTQTCWSSNRSNMYCLPSTSSTCSVSGNMTENVRVDSSFHVAEIVGKQGA